VDPATRAAAGPELRTGDRPSAIALGEGGAWVTSEGSGTLALIAADAGR
jgi:streptogramin lyase